MTGHRNVRFSTQPAEKYKKSIEKLPETSENQGPLGACLGHPKISGSFCVFGAFCTKQRKMKFVFCFFSWGYRIFVLLFRLNFYKNLDFLDGVTGHVMLMSIIKDREHCHGQSLIESFLRKMGGGYPYLPFGTSRNFLVGAIDFLLSATEDIYSFKGYNNNKMFSLKGGYYGLWCKD